jgi:hypothetical protein
VNTRIYNLLSESCGCDFLGNELQPELYRFSLSSFVGFRNHFKTFFSIILTPFFLFAFVFNDPMFLWRCCSLVLLSLFVSVGSELPPSNYAIYSRDVVFVFDRQYAQIFIYPGSINNSWYKLVFTHLEEYDANFQQKYADVEFGRNFTYTPIFHDDTVQNLNMTAFLSSGAHVIINNFVYSKPTTIHYGGETFTFHASSLRFNIQV